MNKDVKTLSDTLYGIQVGMETISKNKLNTEKISIFYIRLERSLRNTLKQIWRDENPNPLYKNSNKDAEAHIIKDKKKKDEQLEIILRGMMF